MTQADRPEPNKLTFDQCTAECEPLVMAIWPEFAERFCNYCLAKLAPALRCTGCKFVFYCSARCQKKDRSEHKHECARLNGKFDDWKRNGLGVSADGLLFFRLLLKEKQGALADAKAVYSGKTIANLMSHLNDIRRHDNYHALAITKLCTEGLLCERVDDKLFLELFAKTMINYKAFAIWNGSEDPTIEQTDIGYAIYLDYAGYNNSCRPNVQTYQIGRKLRVVPFPDAEGRPLVDAHDVTRTFVAYVNLAATKGIRRFQLDVSWLFECACERCTDVDDGLLSGIACCECRTPIAVDDSSFRRCWDARFRSVSPGVRQRLADRFPELAEVALRFLMPEEEMPAWRYYTSAYRELTLRCAECNAVQPIDHVELALCLMSLIGGLIEKDADVIRALMGSLAVIQRFDSETSKILPDKNIFRSHVNLTIALQSSNADVGVRAVRYEKLYEVTRMCFPHGHAGRFEEGLSTCTALLAAAKFERAAAILNDVEAMARLYFEYGTGRMGKFDEVCPFAQRIKALRECVEKKQAWRPSAAEKLQEMLAGLLVNQ